MRASLTLISSTALITNCTFTRLYANFGAAIAGYDRASFTVADSVFHDNEAGEGCILYTCAFSMSLLLASADPNLRAQTWTRT